VQNTDRGTSLVDGGPIEQIWPVPTPPRGGHCDCGTARHLL